MKRNKRGFTLVELVIVIAVIAILAGVLLPTFASMMHKARLSAREVRATGARDDFFSYGYLSTIADMNGYVICVENTAFKVKEDGSLSLIDVSLEDYYEGTDIEYVSYQCPSNDITISYPMTDTSMDTVKGIRNKLALHFGITDYKELEGYVIYYNSKIYIISDSGNPYTSSQTLEEYFANQTMTTVDVEDVTDATIYEPRDEEAAQTIIVKEALKTKLNAETYEELSGYIIRCNSEIFKLNANGDLIKLGISQSEYFTNTAPTEVENVSDKSFINVYEPLAPGAYKADGTFTTWAYLKQYNKITVSGGEFEQSYQGSIDASYTVLILDKEVTSLKDDALKNNNKLTYVGLPDSITSIGAHAFMGCTMLKNIELPCNLEVVSKGLFQDCNALENVYFPKTLTTISEDGFTRCYKLKSVVLPDSVTTIGNNAFSGCKEMLSFSMSDNVTTIGYGAFGGCLKVETIKLSNSITTLGIQTFMNCNALKSITLPINLTSFGDNTFSYCYSVEHIYYNAKNVKGPSSDSSKRFSTVGQNATSCVLHIASSVTTIPDYLFCGAINITNMEVEENSQLTTIGKSVFYDSNIAMKLKNIIIPDSVTSIGSKAFYKTKKVESIYFGTDLKDAVYSKKNDIFMEVAKDATSCELTIGNNVTILPDNLFYYYDSSYFQIYYIYITSIIFEENSKLETIGINALAGTKITELNLPASVKTLKATSISNAPLTTLYIPQTVINIETNAIQTTNLVINCEAESCPAGYQTNWFRAGRNITVNWGVAR